MRIWLHLLNLAAAAVLGIDYGAEFTKASLVAPNIPFEIILTPESKRKDASGIVFRVKGSEIERFYGSGGLPLTSRFPESSLYYFKSLLGQGLDSEEVADFQVVHPGLNLTSNKRGGISVSLGETSYPVEQIVAMSFKEIKSRAQMELKQKLGSGKVEKAAIAVPGHFNMAQRRAISDAASLADLQLISLVNDGVAVAINYASTRQFDEKQYIVVYDMGSESTSASLVSIEDRNGTVIRLEGYSSIPVGGKTLTTKVRDILIKASGYTDLPPKVLNRLWKEAERAKAVLSANAEVSVFIESLYQDKDLSTKITRQQLEDSASDVVEDIATPLLDSLETFDGEKLEAKHLSSVILTGGGTRVPFVQREIKKVAGDILSKNVNADESAVLGTTLRAVGISGIFKSKPMVVEDRVLKSYSLSDGSSKQPLFERGAALDSSRTLQFPANDMTLSLFENDDKIVSWTFPQLAEVQKMLESDERKCVNEPEIATRFSLSHSSLVTLMDVQVQCDTESIGADGEITTKTTSRFLSAKRVDAGVSPLTNPEKEELGYGLRVLDKQDADRLKKQTLHNNLESLLYQIRELDPENERAHQLLEDLENNPTVVQLSEKLKEAEASFATLKESFSREEFAETVKSALQAVGLEWGADLPKILSEASLEQLKRLNIKNHGALFDEFRATLKKIIDDAEASKDEL